MGDNITRETDASVEAFLDGVEHAGRREDGFALLELMRRVTGAEPRMWGTSLVGFGRYHYHYESGREGDWFRVGFSPRKTNLALHLMARGDDFDELLGRLGRHKAGVSCVYVTRLSDIDMGVLEALVRSSWSEARKTFGEP